MSGSPDKPAIPDAALPDQSSHSHNAEARRRSKFTLNSIYVNE